MSRRSLAIAMVVVQIGTLVIVMDTRVAATAYGVALALASIPRLRWAWGSRRIGMACFLLACIFLAEAQLWPLPARTFSPLMSSTTARAVAQFCLAVQILLLFVHKQTLPRFYPLLAIGALTFAGSVVDYGRMAFGFELSAVVMGLLLLLYFMASHEPGRPPMASVRYYVLRVVSIGCVLTLGLSVAYLLKRYQDDLDLMFTRFVNLRTVTTTAGLSDMSQLNSVSQFRTYNENDVALRVESDGAPGYLRSRVFSMYRGNQWGIGVNRWHREPVPKPAGIDPDGPSFFTIRKAPLNDMTRLDIWPSKLIAGRLLAPLDAVAFQLDVTTIVVDDNQAAEASEFRPGGAFAVYVTDTMPQQTPHDATLQACLSLPDSVSEAIRDLARHVFEDTESTDEKIAAVLEHFSRYEYRLGTTVPHHEDPLTYFLTQRPPAHCEFFASGAAVLLRLGGVPSRYVTGFVPTEYNRFAECWVARNKDAHAWVEAYDPHDGWMTLDPTPGSGQPQAGTHSTFALIWDALKFEVAAFAALVREDVGGAIERLAIGLGRLLVAALVATTFGRAVLAVLALVLAIVLLRRCRNWRVTIRWRARRGQPAELRRMERRLRRRHVARGVSETLHQFAVRIERDHGGETWARDAAVWYRDYANRRYGKRP